MGKPDVHPPLKASGLEDATFKLKQSGCYQVNILHNNFENTIIFFISSNKTLQYL